MANPIKPKSTTTASKIPATGDLITGELASNIADGVLFLKKSDGTIATFGTGTGTVSSVAMTVPTGLTITGSPITTTGTLAITFTSGYSIPTTSKQTTWDTAYSERQQWDGGSTNLVAATARTSLGLVIGTNVQAWDADLDSIAGLAGTSGLLKKTAANTWSLDTSSYLTANQSITLSGDISGTGSTTISTTLATVTIAKGGTGQTTQQAAINALTGTQSSGKYLRSDGTNATLASIQAADVPTLNQNTTGSSATCTGNAATATSLAGGSGGTIPYQSAAGTTAMLANGTAGQLLQANGGTSAPSWVASPVVPTGSLFPYAGSSAPTGYLLCDGSSVSSTNYLALHAVISNTYGGSAYTGGSGLNFNLPDLRGRFPMGSGVGSGLNASGTGAPSGTAQTARTRGQWGGEETNLLSINEIPSHNHNGVTGNAGSHFHSFGAPALSYASPNGNITVSVPSGTMHRFSDGDGINDTNTVADHSHSIPNQGGGGRHNTVPPFVVLNYIIKT
jgi:microcystin-dependent protein